MNREEIEAKKKELMMLYERMLVKDTEGTLGEYSFTDYLIMTIDFIRKANNDLRWGNNK